jgi:signal transduction histidine kinase
MIRVRSGTVRRRFTILYAAVFLISGAGLLALTYLLSVSGVSNVEPAPNQPPDTGVTAAEERVRALQHQLAEMDAEHSRQLLVGSLVALVVMALVSLVLGRALAGRVLRPLRLITAATRRISADNLDQRLAVAGPADEVKDLADTIDALLARLEASFAAQRRFVANASHELRTPLTTMRATLDVAAAKPEPAAQAVVLADRLRDQLDRVDHLLDGFLVLARAQHGALAERVPVSLAELVGEAFGARAADVAAKNLTLDEDIRPGVWTLGSPALLSRMVENVIENAVVHNRDGGWIRILIRTLTGHEGAEAHLVVETGGRVLDQRQVDRLTRPFERLGADRTGSDEGSGLGLSIVAAIAAAHDGRLDLLARPEGGLRASIALPSIPAPVEGAA